ncbi:MAG: hypothetical protein A3H42_06915 [Deltaproteobacteria bacterium RIFCSPLOWO2_02_FULL_46_8]|nr:MAG: hypothetical protein A3H42_06915 [Deltaproteobacteria bacterium RIFCSPLOWO2_02_FULL_46_8]
MKKKEVIAVTGGDGFAGSHIVQALVRAGYPVAVLDRQNSARSKIKDLKGDIKYFKVNLLYESALKRILKKINPTVILHLAADTNPDRDPKRIRPMMRKNFDVALNLYYSALELKKLKCIITFGSAGEYEQGKMPFVETQQEMPASPYSFSKTCVSHLSSYFYRVHHLPILVVRPSVLYGEYQTGNQLIPLLIRKCGKNETIDMTKGDQVKDFIYVRDLVDAILKITAMINNGRSHDVIGKTINLCTGEKIKIKNVAQLIKKEIHSKSRISFGIIPYRNAENRIFYGSNHKAKSLLNWSPKYSFEEGIRNTVDWYRKFSNHSKGDTI